VTESIIQEFEDYNKMQVMCDICTGLVNDNSALSVFEGEAVGL